MPKRDSSGNSNFKNGAHCSRNMVSKSNGARRNLNPQAALEASRNQSVSYLCQLVLLGATGIIPIAVVEQDVPPLLPVWIMRTLQASLD